MPGEPVTGLPGPQRKWKERLMAKFKSDSRALVLQDDDGVWARFAEHEFDTDDKDVAARLRKVDGVSEVKSHKAADDDEGEKPASKSSK